MAKHKIDFPNHHLMLCWMKWICCICSILIVLNIGLAYAEPSAEPSDLELQAESHLDLQVQLDKLITLSSQRQDQTEDNKSRLRLSIIYDHIDAIITTPDLSIRAMILARQSDDLELALKIGSAAIDHLNNQATENPQTPRLIYELAYTLLLAGDCKRARPLFQVLVHDDYPALYWIKIESRKGLILCPDGLRLLGDFNIEFGHDDNLAGLTPQQSITPQSGSAMERVISSLSPVIDLPNEFNLGTPKQDGYWVKLNPSLWRQWRQSNSILTARLLPSIRLTTPQGYEHINLTGQLSRHQIYETTVGIQSLEIYRNLRQHGENQGQTEDIGGRLFSGLEWQTHTPLLIGAILGQATSKTGDQKTTINQYGYRLGIRSGFDRDDETPLDAKRQWSLLYQSIANDTVPALNALKSKTLSGHIGVFSIGPLDHLSFNFALIRQQPDSPRPWLSHRHVRKDQIIGITSRHRIYDHQVDLILTHHKVRSDDPLDPDTNLRFIIRINQ